MNKTISLAYTRTGNKPPLVLVHGFPLDHTIWNEIVPHLETRFDLVLPDLRGFGGSAGVDTPYTTADMAGDIAALLDDLGLRKVHLAGHSMGGYVALAFAKRYPERLLGLALVSSQAGADSDERKAGRYKTADEVKEKGTDGVVQGMAPKLAADERIRAFSRELMSRQSPSGVIGGLKAMAEREDLRDELAGFDFPFVVIHGDADELVPIDLAREAAARSGSAHLVELEGVGHMPMMEAPRRTAEALMLLD